MAGSRFTTRPESVLEDPGARAVATLYAESFLSAAAANQVPGAPEELSSFLTEVLGPIPRVPRCAALRLRRSRPKAAVDQQGDCATLFGILCELPARARPTWSDGTASGDQ